MKKEFSRIFNNYSDFMEKSLTENPLKPKNVYSIIKKLQNNRFFKIKRIGYSVENRPIYSVSLGTGKTKILAWSQMHGNEPTATRVFFDFINFIQKSENKNIAEKIFSSVTLMFLPMINPDGAERNIRENALGIDINRDASKLISPESQILNKIFSEFRPHFALNLHDQDCYYSVGTTKEPVWIAFLATVSSSKKRITKARRKSMSVIGETVIDLRKAGIKNIARYNDDYEPRAFGDNFSKKGTSVILIEAGCSEKNKNKSLERITFFIAFYTVIEKIIGHNFKSEFINIYEKLPQNRELMLDTIIEDVKINSKYTVSVGIKNGLIEVVGDTSIYGAYEKITAKNLYLTGNYTPHKNADFEISDKNGNTVIIFKKGKIKWVK